MPRKRCCDGGCAITKIEKYIQDIDEESFSKNDLVQDGVIRQIEIIGEAVKRLSNELKSQSPNVPRQDIAGMRDKLIHEYFGVDIGELKNRDAQDPNRNRQQKFFYDQLDSICNCKLDDDKAETLRTRLRDPLTFFQTLFTSDTATAQAALYNGRNH